MYNTKYTNELQLDYYSDEVPSKHIYGGGWDGVWYLKGDNYCRIDCYVREESFLHQDSGQYIDYNLIFTV